MKQNNMLAMILAGGRGSRLHDLTNKVAKPAVSYGGKYRIVDFPLSNCANSGIDIVGVLTQYESILLNSYVAAGRRWGLDAKDSGVFVLPPREKEAPALTQSHGPKAESRGRYMRFSSRHTRHGSASSLATRMHPWVRCKLHVHMANQPSTGIYGELHESGLFPV